MNILQWFITSLCIHDDEILQHFTTKSEFEMLVEAHKAPLICHSLKQKTVTDFKCIKCGRIKREIITNN